jgi:phage shock protein PspC (stress-responsive transcriptional regulator)
MEQKRLYRSLHNSTIGGVCGGLGEYFSTDPVIFRVIFVVAFFAGGSGLLAYLVFWIITPIQPYQTGNPTAQSVKEEPTDKEIKPENMEQKMKQKSDGSIWGGIILITIGSIFLIDRFVPRIDFGDLWPLILVVIGAILIINSFQKNKL